MHNLLILRLSFIVALHYLIHDLGIELQLLSFKHRYPKPVANTPSPPRLPLAASCAKVRLRMLYMHMVEAKHNDHVEY
jgi:hypothetical protein